MRLSRTLGYFGSVNVSWRILPREASAADVSSIYGSLIFYEGQKEAFLEFSIIDDDLPEPMEVSHHIVLLLTHSPKELSFHYIICCVSDV